MKILYTMLTIRKKIEARRVELSEICAPAPKGQMLTGMPRGGVARNAAEDYVERKEKLSAEIETLYDKLNNLWQRFESYCKKCDCSYSEIWLMKYHYYYNYSWKIVQMKMQERFATEKWNKNRVFRLRRQILNKIDPRFLCKR